MTDDMRRDLEMLRGIVDALVKRHEALERRTGELTNLALRNEDASQRALRRVDELSHEQRGMIAGIENIIRRQMDATVADLVRRFEKLEGTNAEQSRTLAHHGETLQSLLERMAAGQAAAKVREEARVLAEARDRERIVELERKRAHALERLKVIVPAAVAIAVAALGGLQAYFVATASRATAPTVHQQAAP